MSSHRSSFRAVLMLLLLAGCGETGGVERAPGSALWIAPGTAPPDAATLARLGEHGVGELFVDVGTLSWSGSSPVLEQVPEPFVPARRTPATLVVGGEWTAAELESDEVRAILAETLEQWRLESEDRRLLPIGFHFDLEVPAAERAAESFSETIEGLRRSFEQPLTLSLRLPADRDSETLWSDLASAADFVVVPVYGQRPGEPDDPGRWSLMELPRRLERLEALGQPYLVEVVTIGSATFLSAKGSPGENVTIGDLQSLAWNRDLEVAHGSALDRGARQVHEFRAREQTSAALRVLRPGERIRIAAPSTPVIAELLETLGEPRGLYRGVVFYRAPMGGEEFGLNLRQLIDAHVGGDAVRPEIEIDVDVVSRGGGRWALTVTLRNLTDEPTELSVLDASWIQVQLQDAFVNWVRPGHFPRYQTFQTGSDGELYVALRHADTFRLYAPLVRGRDELVAGPVEIRGWRDGKPKMLIGGAFLTPYGGSLELPPEPWSADDGAGDGQSAEPAD